MNEQKITQEIAQTITEQPVKFSIKTRGFLKLFIKKINLNLHDLHCDTLYKISPLLLSLKLDKEATGMDIAYRAIEQHAKTQFKIITIAILDSRWTILKPLLFRFLFHNLTSTELKTLVELVISRMEVVDFINSIVSTSVNLQVMRKMMERKTSPTGTGEKIAPGQPLED